MVPGRGTNKFKALAEITANALFVATAFANLRHAAHQRQRPGAHGHNPYPRFPSPPPIWCFHFQHCGTIPGLSARLPGSASWPLPSLLASPCFCFQPAFQRRDVYRLPSCFSLQSYYVFSRLDAVVGPCQPVTHRIAAGTPNIGINALPRVNPGAIVVHGSDQII